LKIQVPFVKQGKTSSNCGPCTLKMVADYFGVKHPDGRRYSVKSLNRLLRVEFNQGCEKSDMNRVLKRMGLKREKVTLSQISKKIAEKKPIICLFTDETDEGHYSVITGEKKNQLYFNDSYHGKGFVRSKHTLKRRLKPFGNWLWAIND